MSNHSVEDFDWKSEILTEDTVINSFESENEELNDFLINDAKNYSSSLLTVTYLIKIDNEIVAYFSLSNDNITRDNDKKSTWNKINRPIANEKRRKSYPAVKIGRLAVSKKYMGCGFGKLIIDIVRKMYTNTRQQAGCRFITVDAYRNALPFYEKNKFNYLTDKDKSDETRIMYFDLKTLKYL
jgi:predicted GNAT family N-acyltransferase